MSSVFDARETVAQLIAFAIGGFVGSSHMWVLLLEEMLNNMPPLPWRAKSGIYRFLGFTQMTKVALEAEAGFRESYGYTLVTTMAELGGPRPLPKTKAAMDALLSETERRFQLMLKEKGIHG